MVDKDREKQNALDDDDDLDKPMSKPDLDRLAELAWNRYHLVWPPEVEPSDALVSRLTRELKRRTLSAYDMLKVRAIIGQSKGEKQANERADRQASDRDTSTSVCIARS